MKRTLAAAVLAAGLALTPGAAAADCGWSIGLLERELDRIAESLPLARQIDEDGAAEIETALRQARLRLDRARALQGQGLGEACQYAVEDARTAADQARAAFPGPQQSG